MTLGVSQGNTTAGAEVMRLMGDGKVGIGAIPQSHLTIASNGANDTPAELGLWATDVSINDNDTIARIAAQGSDSGSNGPYQGAKIEFNADAIWDTGTNYYWPTRIDFFTQNQSGTNTTGSPRLTISSDGRVGVGEMQNPPEAPLHIRATNDRGLLIESTDPNAKLEIKASDSSYPAVGGINDEDRWNYLFVQSNTDVSAMLSPKNSWWNNGEEVRHIDTVVKKGFDVLPVHRWTSHNIAELKGDKTKINWVRIGMKDNNFYVKKQGHAYARSELNG